MQENATGYSNLFITERNVNSRDKYRIVRSFREYNLNNSLDTPVCNLQSPNNQYLFVKHASLALTIIISLFSQKSKEKGWWEPRGIRTISTKRRRRRRRRRRGRRTRGDRETRLNPLLVAASRLLLQARMVKSKDHRPSSSGRWSPGEEGEKARKRPGETMIVSHEPN